VWSSLHELGDAGMARALQEPSEQPESGLIIGDGRLTLAQIAGQAAEQSGATATGDTILVPEEVN
jgi:hypothetical protein